MSQPLLLGIDGGGTTTIAWLSDADGHVLGKGTAGPSNPKAVGMPSAFQSLEAAVERAFQDAQLPSSTVEVACLGLAGFARPDDQALLHEWAGRVSLTRTLLPVTDGALVLAAGTPEGWGVGVIAGTGSIAVGRDPQGVSARAGGCGPLFGDEGSAYSVVVSALRRVARRSDGREATPTSGDPLTSRLCEALGVADASGLVSAVYGPPLDRTQIAGLAPVVVRAAEEDPAIVTDLLEPAGHELGSAASAVAASLGWNDGPLPLALAGGFLLATEAVRRGLLGFLERRGYSPLPSPVPEPVRGALILAGQTYRGSAPSQSSR